MPCGCTCSALNWWASNFVDHHCFLSASLRMWAVLDELNTILTFKNERCVCTENKFWDSMLLMQENVYSELFSITTNSERSRTSLSARKQALYSKSFWWSQAEEYRSLAWCGFLTTTNLGSIAMKQVQVPCWDICYRRGSGSLDAVSNILMKPLGRLQGLFDNEKSNRKDTVRRPGLFM